LNDYIRKPGTHKEYVNDENSEEYTEVGDTLCLSLKFLAKTDGVLTIGFKGSQAGENTLPDEATVNITSSQDWQILQWEGTWDGKGDFILSYTGDIYVSLLSITDKALEEFKKETSTKFEQTDSHIRLLGTNANELKGTVTDLGIDLDAAEENIRIYAEKHDSLENTVTSLGVRIDAAEGTLSLYATHLNELDGTTNDLGLRMDAAEGTLSLHATHLSTLDGTTNDLGLQMDAVEGTLSLHATHLNTLDGTSNDLGLRMDAAEGTLSLHATHLSTLDGTTNDLGLRMDAAEGNISLYASKESANETSISELQVNVSGISSSVTSLQGDMTAAQSRIETVASVAESAGDAKIYSQDTNPWYSWASGTEHKYVGAIWHNTEDGHDYRYIGYDNKNTWEDVTNILSSASYVLQNQNKISTVVGSFDANGNLTNTSGIVTTAYATEVYATKTTVEGLGDKIDAVNTNLGARLDTAEDNIELYATKESANEASISELNVSISGINSSVTSLQGDLATAQSRIETVASIAESAGDAKIYSQDTNPWQSWTSGTEHKYVGALWHNTKDGHDYRYIGYDNKNTWEDVTGIQDSVSYISQNQNKISAVVGSFDENGNLTNTSGIVTTAYATDIYATKTTVDDLTGRVSTSEATISTHSTQISLRVEKDGVISAINQSSESVTINASKINLNGVTTINNSFVVDTDGTAHIGGFKVSGNGLTNADNSGNYTNDAYIVFRNDTHNCFAGIGGNVLPSTTALRGVARFENHDTSDWWSLGANYAMLVSAQGTNKNVAIQMNGGHIARLAVATECIGLDNVTQSSQPSSKSVTLGTNTVSLYVSTQFYWRKSSSDDYSTVARDINVTLPNMQPYDDGHVIKIKRGVNDNKTVYIKPGKSYRREYKNGTWSVVEGDSCLLCDNAEVSTSYGISSEGNAMEFVYHRDLQFTVGSTTYYGCWIQYKNPRSWG
jgi:peptidoglycan hydrolase CwlO-like protein